MGGREGRVIQPVPWLQVFIKLLAFFVDGDKSFWAAAAVIASDERVKLDTTHSSCSSKQGLI